MFLQLITHLPVQPHHTLWLQIYVWSAGVPACTSVLFFIFLSQITVLFEGVVQSGFLVTLAGKAIIAPGVRLFVSVWVHILCISVCVYVGLWTRGVTGSHPRRGLFLTPHRCPCGCLQGNERPSFFVNSWHIHIYVLCYTLKQKHIYFKIVSCCDIQYTTSKDV